MKSIHSILLPKKVVVHYSIFFSKLYTGSKYVVHQFIENGPVSPPDISQ